MAQAKYTVQVPSHDELGNPLKVGMAAHHYLSYGQLPFQGVGIQYGHPHDHVVAWGEDHPENDSHLKQLGVYAGELANVPHVTVTKEGKNPASWVMQNQAYQQGYPGEPTALANEPNVADLAPEVPGGGLGMGGHPLSPYSNPLERPPTNVYATLKRAALALWPTPSHPDNDRPPEQR